MPGSSDPDLDQEIADQESGATPPSPDVKVVSPPPPSPPAPSDN